MLKQKAKEDNPPPVQAPSFLKHCEKAAKRFRDPDGRVKTTFQPEWGIADQDAISGCSLLAMDWSRFSITEPDKANVFPSHDIDENEQLGALAAYQVFKPFSTLCISHVIACLVSELSKQSLVLLSDESLLPVPDQPRSSMEGGL